MAQIHLQEVTRLFRRGEQKKSYREDKGEETEHSGAEVAALDHVTLTVPDGKTCVIVGPSGSGKSTLLRVVAGLDTDYTGEVYYDNQPMHDVRPGDRYIGMVFQNYALYPHFHGQNNLKFSF